MASTRASGSPTPAGRYGATGHAQWFLEQGPATPEWGARTRRAIGARGSFGIDNLRDALDWSPSAAMRCPHSPAWTASRGLVRTLRAARAVRGLGDASRCPARPPPRFAPGSRVQRVLRPRRSSPRERARRFSAAVRSYGGLGKRRLADSLMIMAELSIAARDWRVTSGGEEVRPSCRARDAGGLAIYDSITARNSHTKVSSKLRGAAVERERMKHREHGSFRRARLLASS